MMVRRGFLLMEGMLMQHIRQLQPHHCAVACLAMVTGREYTTVVKQLGNLIREGGVNEMYVRQFLWDSGYNLRQLYRRNLINSFTDRAIWPPTAFAPIHMVYVTPHHWVAMDSEGTVLDPNRDGRHLLTEYQVYTVIGIYLE